MANFGKFRPEKTLAFLAEILGFTLLLQAAASPVWRQSGNSMAGQLGAWLLYGVIAALLAWVFNRVLRKQGFRELGFRCQKGFWGDIWSGVLGYGVLCILSVPLGLAALADRAKMYDQMIGSARSSLPQALLVGSALAIALGFVTGAFHEEIRFRGYYQGVGAAELTPLAGFLIGFIPFSFGHYFAHPEWSVMQVAATVLPGIVFGLLYHATGSLVAVMTAHTLANWIGAYPALFYSATKSRAAGLGAAAVLWIFFLLLILWRWNREMRAWRELTGKMLRERPVFGLVTGTLLGLALLALWPVRLPAARAGIAGLVLFGAAIATRALRRRAT